MMTGRGVGVRAAKVTPSPYILYLELISSTISLSKTNKGDSKDLRHTTKCC